MPRAVFTAVNAAVNDVAVIAFDFVLADDASALDTVAVNVTLTATVRRAAAAEEATLQPVFQAAADVRPSSVPYANSPTVFMSPVHAETLANFMVTTCTMLTLPEGADVGVDAGVLGDEGVLELGVELELLVRRKSSRSSTTSFTAATRAAKLLLSLAFKNWPTSGKVMAAFASIGAVTREAVVWACSTPEVKADASPVAI